MERREEGKKSWGPGSKSWGKKKQSDGGKEEKCRKKRRGEKGERTLGKDWMGGDEVGGREEELVRMDGEEEQYGTNSGKIK